MADAGILVIRGGAIGDFILTLPVFSALRQHFPRARLGVMGYPRIASVAQRGGLVDNVYSLEDRAMARLFARGSELDPGWKKTWGGASIIVSYLYDPDEIFKENVLRCSAAQFIQGPHRPEDSGKRHASHVLLEPLQRLAVFDADPQPRLRLEMRGASTPAEELAAWIQSDAAPVLAVHPGSGSASKNWPLERWSELMRDWVSTKGYRCLIVGGEADQDLPERLLAALPEGRARLARHLSLSDLGSVLSRCRAFLGHDSGITHLAASLGLPTLVLWGPTVEEVWRPLGEHVRVVRHPAGLSGITVETVDTEARSLLAV